MQLALMSKSSFLQRTAKDYVLLPTRTWGQWSVLPCRGRNPRESFSIPEGPTHKLLQQWRPANHSKERAPWGHLPCRPTRTRRIEPRACYNNVPNAEWARRRQWSLTPSKKLSEATKVLHSWQTFAGKHVFPTCVYIRRLLACRCCLEGFCFCKALALSTSYVQHPKLHAAAGQVTSDLFKRAFRKIIPCDSACHDSPRGNVALTTEPGRRTNFCLNPTVTI